jgi:hypothetical protein
VGVIARPAPLALLDPIQYADGVGYVIAVSTSGTLLLVPNVATGSVTGTGAFTDVGDGVVAAGKVTTSGTTALTEGVDGVVAATSVKVTATGAFTEGADGVVAATSIKVTATGAFTELGDGIVASTTAVPAVQTATTRHRYAIDNRRTYRIDNRRRYRFQN